MNKCFSIPQGCPRRVSVTDNVWGQNNALITETTLIIILQDANVCISCGPADNPEDISIYTPSICADKMDELLS